MFNKVSVLIPTRGRVDRLATLLKSYAATRDVTADNSELVFRVDEDDTNTRDFLESQNVLVGPRLEGYKSLPTFFNELVGQATGDVLMCGNDDMVFVTPQWATRILEAANWYPDGLFDIGVSTHNERNFPFACVSRKAVLQLGHLFHPQLFWGDIYLRDVMAKFGRCVYLDTVEIAHDWAGKKPDVVFLEGNDERFKPRGDEYWQDIHLPAVREAEAKLKRLPV